MKTKTKFLAIYIAIGINCLLINQTNAQTDRVDNFLSAAKPVQINGHLGKKLNQSYTNRIKVQDVEELVKPFTIRNETKLWQSEFWGKWITSAIQAYRYHPDYEMKIIIDKAVQDLIDTQSEDGYIGNYALESRLNQWDIWGRKYCLLGLLDYYELTKNSKSLKAAKKLANHLIAEINNSDDGLIVTKGNYRGMAASSVLEPIVKLYRFTNDENYLKFALRIVNEWSLPQGPQLLQKANVDVSKRFPTPEKWYGQEQGQKAYEMMSCYEGLLELYRITGKSEFLSAVESTWQNIRDTEINIAGSGASEEMWFAGKEKQTMPITHYQETCVTVTWIRFNYRLLALTGEAKYAQEIERSYYNTLLASLSFNGSVWAKYTPLVGQRLPGSGQCGMSLNCCDASGPRGQFVLPFAIVMGTNKGISVNFFEDGLYEVTLNNKEKVNLKMETQYPVGDVVRISLNLKKRKIIPLRIRIPDWSKETVVRVNNESIDDVKSGGYIEITREWTSSDVIEVSFDMRGRLHEVKDGNRSFVAIQRGPVILARDSRLAGPPMTTFNRPVTEADNIIELKSITPLDDNIWMQYEATFIPESYMESRGNPITIQLCDYASAGNGKNKSEFYIWMEQVFSSRQIPLKPTKDLTIY